MTHSSETPADGERQARADRIRVAALQAMPASMVSRASFYAVLAGVREMIADAAEREVMEALLSLAGEGLACRVQRHGQVSWYRWDRPAAPGAPQEALPGL